MQHRPETKIDNTDREIVSEYSVFDPLLDSDLDCDVKALFMHLSDPS